MNRLLPLLLALAATPLAAAPGGPIGTLQSGEYHCELPGDATGPVGFRVSAEDFAATGSSRYTTATGRGTYLLTGDTVTMTSGPKAGERFIRLSANFLRKLDENGRQTPLRCIRRTANNRITGDR